MPCGSSTKPPGRKANQLVRAGSWNKHKCHINLTTFLGIHFVLLFARLQATREEISLLEVVHGLKCGMRFSGGSVNIFTLAGVFHSHRRDLESSKAEWVRGANLRHVVHVAILGLWIGGQSYEVSRPGDASKVGLST